MTVLGAPVSHCGNLAFFVAFFSEIIRLYTGVVPHLHSIHSSITQLQEQVYSAVMNLPEKQAKRIYARYYLGMTVNEIAGVEGVDPSRVRDSIRRGLKQLGKYF